MNHVNQIGSHLQSDILSGFSMFGLSQQLSSWLVFFATLAAMLLFSFLFYFIAKHYLLRLVAKIAKKRQATWIHLLFKYKVMQRLVHLIPAVFIYSTANLLAIAPTLFNINFVEVFQIISIVYLMLTLTAALLAFLNLIEERLHNFSVAHRRPIKSYIQIVKIFLCVFSGILVISELLNKSPAYLLTSIGAMTAFILLIFKDSILGFVASIQIAVDDLVRIGDWIEVPQYGVDGDVIDISLNSVKVQNFDKTIITIPTYALLSNGVKNWRGMNESGGRRIKRAINIDINSIKFCSADLLNRMHQAGVINHHQLTQYLEMHKTSPVNNVTLFRNFLKSYLQEHPAIHKSMTLLVRQLENIGKGLPIEIYVFTNDTNWAKYEEVQSNIFDYIYAVLPLFELRAFQHLSGPILPYKSLLKNIEENSLQQFNHQHSLQS